MGGHLRGSDIIGTAGRHQPHWHAVQLYNETTRYKFIWSFSQSSKPKQRINLYEDSLKNYIIHLQQNKISFVCITDLQQKETWELSLQLCHITTCYLPVYSELLEQQLFNNDKFNIHDNFRNKDSEDETFCVCTFVNSPLTKKTKKKNKP